MCQFELLTKFVFFDTWCEKAMDVVDITEVPIFVYVYTMQLYEINDDVNIGSLVEIECRLYKSKEDAIEGGKIALQQYECSSNNNNNSSNQRGKLQVNITKTLAVWDAEQRYVTLLESSWQIGCKMSVSMIQDQARGYIMGQSVKSPIMTMLRPDLNSNRIEIS